MAKSAGKVGTWKTSAGGVVGQYRTERIGLVRLLDGTLNMPYG